MFFCKQAYRGIGFLIGLMISLFAGAQQVGLPPEFHQRGGLPNFFEKALGHMGKEIRIAYLGGSITEAPHGWRDYTLQGISTAYPYNHFRQIDAGIGGTGSNLGVFRLEQDVLAHHPDLIFVEFAVNDYGESAESIYRSIEGIVRKIWRWNSRADICFVYTVTEKMAAEIDKGAYQRSAIVMEKIAAHYGIPSIHVGVEVVRLWRAGKLVLRGEGKGNEDCIVFSTDGVHPLPSSGHPIYANRVMKYLKEMQKNAVAKDHVLAEPLVSDNWEHAKMISVANFGLHSAWESLPDNHEIVRRFAKFMPKVIKAVPPGATLKIKFRGRTLGFYDVIGPGTGILDVTVDGVPGEIYRFDRFSDNFRKNAFFLAKMEDGTHEVVIRVTGKNFDKEGILLSNNNEMNNPDRYRENAWYLGSILVIGELLSVSDDPASHGPTAP